MGPPEPSDSHLRLALKRVDLCEAQMGAQEARLQLDGFLEETGAFGQSFLLKPYRAQNGIGDGARRLIREGQACLLVGLLQTPLLDQQGGLLECRAPSILTGAP